MKAHKLFLFLLLLVPSAVFAAQARPDVVARNSDGSIRSRGVYETNAAGQVTKYTLFDGTGNVQSVEVPFYGNDGKVVRADTYDRNGKLTAIAVYLIDYNQVKVLDPQGNVIRTTDFAADTFMRPANGASAWLDGALPDGATPSSRGGDNWTWINASPALPMGGSTRVHQSTAASGQHEHSFEGASNKLSVSGNANLFCWVYLDPSASPSEVMLMWKDGSGWEHRAYWGNNSITYGQDNSPGRYRAGDLPPRGQWTKLSVPASAVGLVNASVDGMGFALVDGRAEWGPAGAE